jgi:hypothetical protein
MAKLWSEGEHIVEERLFELASEKDYALPQEDAHLENCPECLRKFVELAKSLVA